MNRSLWNFNHIFYTWIASVHSIIVLKLQFLLFFFLPKTVKKYIVFFKSPPFCYLSINVNIRRMHESYDHTESKYSLFFCFRWAVIKISTPPATYLLFEKLSLPSIFPYKKFLKWINFFLYFESVFIEPKKFSINIYNNKLLKKFTKIAFFWASKPEWSLKAKGIEFFYQVGNNFKNSYDHSKFFKTN